MNVIVARVMNTRTCFRRGAGADRRVLLARIPPELHAELHRMRHRKRVSISELVREAVEAFLTANEAVGRVPRSREPRSIEANT